MAQLGDLVAPELQPHRLCHPEAVDVEDSSAHAELRDVIHHLHALEPDRLEVGREILRPAAVPFTYLESSLGERARQLRLLEQRPGGSEQDPDFAASDSLEGLDTLARDFGVRLYLAEALARGIESNEAGIPKGLEISEPSLGAGDAFGNNDEKPSLTGVRQRGYGDCVAGTGETGSV